MKRYQRKYTVAENFCFQEAFERNRDEIDALNRHAMLEISGTAAILLLLVSVVGFSLSGWGNPTPIYFFSTAVCSICFLCCLFVVPLVPDLVLPIVYFHFCMLFFAAIYHSLHNGGTSAASIAVVALLLILPMTITDLRAHILLLIAAVCAVFCIGSLIYLPYTAMVNNVLCCLVFGVFGLVIGENMCVIRVRDIENRRLLSLQRDLDILTGLPNRRKLLETLDALEQNSPAQSLGVLMIDVDQFKRYNDTLGHQAGDFCIGELGTCFSDFADQTGIPMFRFGGEEFLGLFAGCTPNELAVQAHQLVQVVEALEIPYPTSETGYVTISVGFAHQRADAAQESKALIARADQALYLAKEQGRNRAVGY